MKQAICGSIKGHRTFDSAKEEVAHLTRKTGLKWLAVWHHEHGGYWTVERA